MSHVSISKIVILLSFILLLYLKSSQCAKPLIVNVNQPLVWCSNDQTSFIQADVTGGNPPYTYVWNAVSFGGTRTLLRTNTTFNSTDYLTGVSPVPSNIDLNQNWTIETAPLKVLTDNLVNGFGDDSWGGNCIADDTTITPHTPSTENHTYSFLPIDWTGASFSCLNYEPCFDTSIFKSFEFWVSGYPGGGQRLNADTLDGYNVQGGSSPFVVTKEWQLFSYDLTAALPSNYVKMWFQDATGTSTQKRIYFNDITLIPRVPIITAFYEVIVTDSNNVSVTHSNITVQQRSNPLSASVLTTSATCFNFTDATATVEISGGVAPYFIQWFGIDGLNSTSTMLDNLGATATEIISQELIYHNGLAPSGLWGIYPWASYITIDTSMKGHTSTYALSFVPSNLQALFIACETAGCINVTTYNHLEFWINGGAAGGQLVDVQIVVYLGNNNNSAVTSGLIGSQVQLDGGLTSIPANTWVHGSMDLSVLPTSRNYDAIWFRAAVSSVQSTVYLDDIVLTLRLNPFINSTQHIIDSTDLSNTPSSKFLVPGPFYDPTLFNVQVIDSSGSQCLVEIDAIQILQPHPLEVIPFSSQAKCYGTNTGIGELTITGGTLPYNVTWYPSEETGLSVFNLSPGNNNVTVFDANECTDGVTYQVFVLQPPPLTMSVSVGDSSCYNSADGYISVRSFGGTPPYTYTFISQDGATFQNQPFYSNMVLYSDTLFSSFLFYTPSSTGSPILQDSSILAHSGVYSIGYNPAGNSRDMLISCSNCFSNTNWEGIEFWIQVVYGADQLESIDQLDSVTVAVVNFNSVGSGNTTNQFQSTLSSIISPFDNTSLSSLTPGDWIRCYIDFNDNGISGVIAGLSFGSSGNSSSARIYIDDIVAFARPGVGTVSSVFQNVPLGVTGKILGQSGTYTVTVSDLNGCSTVSSSYVINEPTSIQVDSTSWPSAQDLATGSVDMNITGGVAPYRVNLESESTNVSSFLSIQIDSLASGNYPYIVIDSHNCQYSGIINIRELPSDLVAVSSNRSMQIALMSLAAISMVLAIAAFIILVLYWRSFAYLSPPFCAVIIVGAFLGFACVFILLQPPTAGLCAVLPWMFGFAFDLVYAALFLKAYRVWKIFHIISTKPLGTNAAIRNRTLFGFLGIVLLIEGAFLAIWTALDPLHVAAVPLSKGYYQMQCYLDSNGPAFGFVFLITKGLWLVFGVVVCIKSRLIFKQEMNEAKPIAFCIYNAAVIVLFCSILVAVLRSIADTAVIIISLSIIIMLLFTLVALFWPTWSQIFQNNDNAFLKDNKAAFPDRRSGVVKIEMATAETTENSPTTSPTNSGGRSDE